MSRRACRAAATLAAFLATAGAAAADEAGCRDHGLAGLWRNTAPAEGSDVVAAEIRVDCRRTAQAANGPRVDLVLTVRCLRYDCTWRPIPGQWTDRAADEDPLIAARLDEERVERQFQVTAPDGDRIRLTVTTRFRTVPLEPRRITYTLQRAR